jgi:hypothetical protein
VLTERRSDREVEFIQRLSEILDLKGMAFAKKIGKQPPNVHGYLAGKNIPRKKVLHSALRHAFEWEVTPLVEVQSVEEHANQLPQTPGVYCFYDSSGSVIYVGQATKLKTEVGLALQRGLMPLTQVHLYVVRCGEMEAWSLLEIGVGPRVCRLLRGLSRLMMSQ